MMRRITCSGWLLLGAAFLSACSAGPRPGDLVKVDRMMQDKASLDIASKAAPQVFKEAQQYYKLAEEAYDDGDSEECIYHATMAAITLATAQELGKRAVAEERRVKAESRKARAEQTRNEMNVRLADARKRIARMENILALKAKLDEEKKKSEAEKKRVADELAKAKAEAEAEQKAAAERLAAEQAKAEDLKAAQKVQEMLASASSQIQAAEALEAKTYDPVNLNSAKTYVEQSQKAIAEKRFANAKDLARLAGEKAALATQKAQAEYAKKKQEADILKEREALFSEANGIAGLEVKQEKRGVVMSLRDMFASRQAIVLPERTYLLDKIAELAEKYKDFPVVVEGYTDSLGRPEDNLALSVSRAQSVLDYLVQQKRLGFDRIKSSGYGAANPIADNSSGEGRSKNRRVEVIFLFR